RVQLFALQPQGLPALVRAARALRAAGRELLAVDLYVQQARDPAPLLFPLRLCAVWLRRLARQGDGGGQRPLPRRRRAVVGWAQLRRRALVLTVIGLSVRERA